MERGGYRSLQADREQADMSEIIRQLHQVVDEVIATQPDRASSTTTSSPPDETN